MSDISSVVTVQRKIMPWETLTSDDTSEARRAITDSRRMTDLIVVASLVDKVPNLAGLARTCEIFGAGSLVIGNKVKGFTEKGVLLEEGVLLLVEWVGRMGGRLVLKLHCVVMRYRGDGT